MQWVADIGSGPESSPTLVDVDPTGDVFVLSYQPNGTGTTDLLLQRLNADGTSRWSANVATKASGVLTPAMVLRDDGTTAVAWSSFDAKATAPADYGIGVTTVGPNGDVAATVTIPHKHAALLLDFSASGNVVVAFDKEGDKRTTVESWAPTGSLAWRSVVPEYGFAPDYSGLVRTTTIHAIGDGSVVVAGVVGKVEQSTDADVRLLDNAGKMVWTTKL